MKDSSARTTTRRRSSRARKHVNKNLEQQLGSMLASYNDDFPSAAFPSFLVALEHEQLTSPKFLSSAS